MAPRRYHFANPTWFRVPLKALVLAVAVFSLLSLYPSFTDGTSRDVERALLGVVVVVAFIALATTFAVAIADSYVEADGRTLYIHFEGFFNAEMPLDDIGAVRYIDPRPRWRYRWGLSTNLSDRVCCSHGGRLVEVELARAWPTRVWPRKLAVRRVWLAVVEHEALIRDIEAAIAARERRGTEPERTPKAA